jgi:hypothetical protein
LLKTASGFVCSAKTLLGRNPEASSDLGIWKLTEICRSRHLEAYRNLPIKASGSLQKSADLGIWKLTETLVLVASPSPAIL